MSDTNRCQSRSECEKKQCKPIIPKIKSSNRQQENCCEHKSPNKKQSSPQKAKKLQSTSYIPHYSSSHMKHFPKQEDLEKMTKKQLAETYYEQFLRLHRENQVLDKQLAFVRYQRDLLYKRFTQLKEDQKDSEDIKPKRQRRVADQIQRKFGCPVGKCHKSYGSEGSLIQHIKLKHQDFYKSPSYQAFLNSRKQDE